MKTKYIVFILASILVFSKACETTEKIDDFPLRPSRLVLNSYFTADSSWSFQVSKSLSVLDNAELQLVENAKIYLYKNSDLIDSISEADEYGIYRSDSNLPVAEEKYSIEVAVPDFKNRLLAEDIIPSPVEISNVSISIIDSSFFRNEWYDEYYDQIIVEEYGSVEGSFNIKINDPASRENYYEISIYTYYSYPDYSNPDEMYVEKNQLYFSTEDPIAEGNENETDVLLFSDELFNGQGYQIKLKFKDWNAQKDKNYFIELTSLNRPGYLYKRTVKEFRNSDGDPFSEPVLIYSNIENGYGIFAGYSKSEYSVGLLD